MRFKTLKAENLYSFKKLDFNFNYKGTTLIIGRNEDQKTANGAGKTSLLKALYLGLWGKEMYGESIDLVTHRGADDGYLIELTFEDRGHEFKIVRYRDRKDKDPKTGVDFYINDQLFNGESATDTQRIIERKIKISPRLFKSAVMTTQDEDKHFLTVSDTEKKEIFSELLDLTAYSQAFDYVKKEISALEGKIDEANQKVEHFSDRIKERQSEVEQYQEKEDRFEDEKLVVIDGLNKRKILINKEIEELIKNNAEVENLEKEEVSLKGKLDELTNQKTELSKDLEQEHAFQDVYNEYTIEITTLKSKIEKFTEKKNEAKKELDKLIKRKENPSEFEIKISKLKNDAGSVQGIIKELSLHKEKVESLMESSLNVCKEFDSNIEVKIKELKISIEVLDEKLVELAESIKSPQEKREKLKIKIDELKTKRASFNQLDRQMSDLQYKINDIQRKKQKYSNVEPEINAKKEIISEIDNKIEEERSKKNIYKDVIEQAKKKIEGLTHLYEQNKKIVVSLEDELVYLNFWKAAFSPLGIRSFIFDEVIDLLNQKVQNNLNDLFEGALSVIFESESKNSKGAVSNKIATKFYLNGKETTFGLLSGGEKRRAILAVNLALTEIAESYSGTAMNIKFLDEPFNGIDGSGQIQCFKLFARLAQTKDGFFVISHDQSFQQLCPNAIYIIKENGESRIVSKNEFEPVSDLSSYLSFKDDE